jgi:protein disulfide-isomerase
MKTSLFLLLTLLATTSMAQTTAYTAENEGWLVDLDQAYALSKKEGKPIMANFTGSDWCGWCKRLTASVFSQPEFQTWAKKNVILLELDFPRRKTIPEKYRNQNYSMQNALKVTGYPTVWVFNIDKNGTSGQYQLKPIGKTGYRATVTEFTTEVDKMIKG